MYTELNYTNSLYHSGIKGQKWGVRRFQNEDGSLTEAGKERYGVKDIYKTYRDYDSKYDSKTTSKYKDTFGESSEVYKRSKKLDDEFTKRRENESVVKNTVKNILMTEGTRQTYDMARTAGYGRGRSFVKSCLDINVSRLAEGTARSIVYKNTTGSGTGKVASNLAITAAGKGTGSAVNKTGTELSLQQRSIRKKYVEGRTPSYKK